MPQDANRNSLDYAGPEIAAARRRIAPYFVGVVLLGLVLVYLFWLNSGRAGPRVKQMNCALNLRQLGMDLYQLAGDNGGSYPARIEDLSIEVPSLFVCPASKDKPPEGTSHEERAQSLVLGGHFSYVYVGRGKRVTDPPDTILLYESSPNHFDRQAGDFVSHVLLNDGNVLTVRKSDFAILCDELKAGRNPVGSKVRFGRPPQ